MQCLLILLQVELLKHKANNFQKSIYDTFTAKHRILQFKKNVYEPRYNKKKKVSNNTYFAGFLN